MKLDNCNLWWTVTLTLKWLKHNHTRHILFTSYFYIRMILVRMQSLLVKYNHINSKTKSTQRPISGTNRGVIYLYFLFHLPTSSSNKLFSKLLSQTTKYDHMVAISSCLHISLLYQRSSLKCYVSDKIYINLI